MAEDRATSFLQMIRRAERGRLKLYLGYGPGVGKTWQMLTEARRLKGEGIDVVVGLVETHGRADTAKLIEGLEVVPRRKVEYRGITLEEMDLDAVLARKPQVALVDELAHTNVPGSRNEKRWEDVQELLAAGIHVISTLNVQHLESLYNAVERLVGVKVRERIPDAVVAEADQIVNVDLSAEDLQQRLKEGKVYPKDRVATAMANYFQAGNLEQLRELTMREIASQIDFRRREATPTPGETAAEGGNGAPDQLMVCLSSRGPNSARLLRFASRLAGRLNRNWYAVYVQTPSEEPTLIDATTQRLLADTLTLANQLGATVFTFKGADVPDTILRFAREYRVGQIVIGRPAPRSWWKRLLHGPSIAERLVRQAGGVNIIVADVDQAEPAAVPVVAPGVTAAVPDMPPAKPRPSFAALLKPSRILIWEDPVSKAQVLRQLVETITRNDGGGGLDSRAILESLSQREEQGSTFLNEGVALPHARIEGLSEPQVALGLTHAGVLDAPTEKPIEAVFLLLSPAQGAASHLQLLASAGRALQNRELRRQLSRARLAPTAMEALLSQ